MLRHHRHHLGPAADQPRILVDVGVAFLQRDRRRQRGADPQIALFQLGQESEPRTRAQMMVMTTSGGAAITILRLAIAQRKPANRADRASDDPVSFRGYAPAG